MNADYSLVGKLLSETTPQLSPALVHGAVTGYISSGATLQPSEFGDLFEINLPQVVEELVKRLGDQAREQLDSDFQFHPLLPEDDASLKERLDALSQWCDWFNIGFAAGFMRPQTDLSTELMEVLNDFGQLANVDPLATETDEQDEANFMEVLEYVRMAAVSVYQLMNTDMDQEPQGTSASENSIPADPEQLH